MQKTRFPMQKTRFSYVKSPFFVRKMTVEGISRLSIFPDSRNVEKKKIKKSNFYIFFKRFYIKIGPKNKNIIPRKPKIQFFMRKNAFFSIEIGQKSLKN
jgi:hypothetical protein